MRIWGLVIALAMGAVGAASAQSVSGTYNVAGKNFDGSPYGGTVQITPSGSSCRIKWQTGGTMSEGVCMLANKAFAAFYKLGSDYGLVVYELQPDGSLRGSWTVAGKQGVGTEILTPKR
ncbi:MAG: hypothetical protein U1E60_19040 [Reyranellaceae bacterium]